MPADRRIQPDPWAYPVHRSAGQRNHVVRGDTVFDPIYWRTWEETLTVDYSTWLASLPQVLLPSKGSFLLILVASLLVLCFLLNVCQNLTVLGWEKIQGLVIIVIIAAWAVGALWLSTRIGVEPQYETFVEKTERTFGVSRLKCETLAGCPSDKLPEDRTPATWVQGDRYVKGWILVDNNKVSLAGSHGILLTSKES